MDNDIFRAGPGGLSDGDEIKMLICHILAQVGAPMSFSQLHEVVEETGLVNYFELVRAISALKRTGHLQSDPEASGSELYFLTAIGQNAAEVLESSLPLSAREKAAAVAKRLLCRQRRELELHAEILPLDSGYRLELAIPDHNSALVSFSLFVATRAECEAIRRNFLNDPLFIYKGVVALLTGNDKVWDDIFPQQEKLFR